MSETVFDLPAGSPAMEIRRELDAPAALVFRTQVEPALLARWMGPRRLRMEVDHVDARHGGSWRFEHVDTDGSRYGFRGVFHGDPSVEAGITRTFEFEGAPGHVALETAAFDERDGRTLLVLRSVYPTVAERDAHLAAGMEGGVREGLDRLAELLAETQAP